MRVLVAQRDEGALVGFVEVSLRPVMEGSAQSPVGYIEGWYVSPDFRRRGVGRALIAAAEVWARDQGCRAMGSDCHADNHASHLAHLSLGYQHAAKGISFFKRISEESPFAVDFTAVLATPLSVTMAVDLVADLAAGGIDVFLGTTRGETHADGRQLVALDYEAYLEMAEQQLRDLAKRAREKWPIVKAAILHRIGRVEVGEASVLIAVSAPHRSEAFEACRWLIDSLKQEVAIWKKEVWADGSSSWVHPTKG